MNIVFSITVDTSSDDYKTQEIGTPHPLYNECVLVNEKPADSSDTMVVRTYASRNALNSMVLSF